MTENDIMELISKDYLKTVAHKTGYVNFNAEKDFGVDLHFRKVIKIDELRRIFDDGFGVDIQLKSTHEKSISYTSDFLKYNFDVKNYNDLIDRQKRKAPIPLILILFIVPNNTDDFVNVSAEQLIVKKCAYWFQIDETVIEYSDNKSNITISIPKEQIVTMDFFPMIFNKLFRK